MKRTCFIAFIMMMLRFGLDAQTVTFSHSGGFYENSFDLVLTCDEGYHIRYTTNGARPTATSRLYDAPLTLNESLYSTSDIYTIQISPDSLFYIPDSVSHCIVIRAAVFNINDSCVNNVTTNSYFINELGCDTHGLPVISICADSLDLFDYNTGIFVPGVYFDTLDPNWTGNYYQTGHDWERPMNIEFYETDNQGINQIAGLRTHGGNGRRFQQKSMKIYAREEYGKKRFKHQFFENIPHNSFKHLTIKPLRSSWNQAGIQDHLCNMISGEGFDFEPLASRPVTLFLNGEYWGIYFIHEKPDERYLEDHFGIDLETLNIMGNWSNLVEYGNGSQFINMMQWLETADLTDPNDYTVVDNFFDLSSFIDYIIFELYSANLDWPANNMCCWQQQNGKWRWIFKDGDACLISMSFNVFANATYVGDETWPANSKSTLLFRKLLENEDFEIRFKNRFMELLDTRLDYSQLSHYLSDIEDEISLEIPAQSDRFGYPLDYDTWMTDMSYTDYFLHRRVQHMKDYLHVFFDSVDDEIDENNISIYPNPTSGIFTINIGTRNEAATTVEVFNCLGQQVYSQKHYLNEGDNSLSMSLNLPQGIYLIKIGNSTQRIIIQ